jgi:hypothetical protein
MSEPAFELDQVVALALPVEDDGNVFAEGTEGVIVGILDNGTYVVALLEPRAERVLVHGDVLLTIDA